MVPSGWSRSQMTAQTSFLMKLKLSMPTDANTRKPWLWRYRNTGPVFCQSLPSGRSPWG